MSQQQQQSKIGTMAPKKIGASIGRAATNAKEFAKLIPKKGAKISAKGMAMPGMDSISQKAKPVIKKAVKKMPTMSQVQKSVKKTMGY